MAKKQQRRGRPHVDEITDVQRNALKEVRDYIAARTYPPTMNELGDLLGVTTANHWFDCLVGCAVAASMQGVTLDGTQEAAAVKRPRVSFAELQRRRRV